MQTPPPLFLSAKRCAGRLPTNTEWEPVTATNLVTLSPIAAAGRLSTYTPLAAHNVIGLTPKKVVSKSPSRAIGFIGYCIGWYPVLSTKFVSRELRAAFIN